MARKRITLRQFSIEAVDYDGYSSLVHAYRRCDWSADVYGMSLADVTRAARAHGRTCDGKPQPRPEPPAAHFSSLISSVWGEEIKAALARAWMATPPLAKQAAEPAGIWPPVAAKGA